MRHILKKEEEEEEEEEEIIHRNLEIYLILFAYIHLNKQTNKQTKE